MPEDIPQYDFVFLGAGCASLSIVCRMIDSGKFASKKILLVDKAPKTKNDRTWCFWEDGDGYFEGLVYKKWESLLFKTTGRSIPLQIKPYVYKMIRGIDFYNHCLARIASHPGITIKYGEIKFGEKGTIVVDGENLHVENSVVFNSIYNPGIQKNPNKIYLLQHFKGWVIETADEIFDPGEATLMDFSISQQHGTAFVYVLPVSGNRALVEYTLFTGKLLAPEAYNSQLKQYCKEQLALNEYVIKEQEFGVIPMTNESFNCYSNGMYHIGTAGGQTKASTGYTFQFIQQRAQQIVESLLAGDLPLKKGRGSKRFHFYDSTLLNILANNKLEGKHVFEELFSKNMASKVFKFLDNATAPLEELRIIKTLPTKEFLLAGITEFFRSFKN